MEGLVLKIIAAYFFQSLFTIVTMFCFKPGDHDANKKTCMNNKVTTLLQQSATSKISTKLIICLFNNSLLLISLAVFALEKAFRTRRGKFI
jgi:hypothetical protein